MNQSSTTPFIERRVNTDSINVHHVMLDKKNVQSKQSAMKTDVEFSIDKRRHREFCEKSEFNSIFYIPTNSITQPLYSFLSFIK